MPQSQNEVIVYRERWLPMLQVVAMTFSWHLQGPALEQFADDIAPYLTQPEITTTQMCVHVIQNYYQDAPLVQLLCDRQAGTEAAWLAIAQSVMDNVQQSDREIPLSAGIEARILARFQTALIQHTYQVRVPHLLTLIMHEELGAVSNCANYEH